MLLVSMFTMLLATSAVSAIGPPVCLCGRFFRAFYTLWICVNLGQDNMSRMESFADEQRDSVLGLARSPTENCDISATNDGRTEIFVERTLAMVKPDAVHRYAEIEEIILRSGFTILNKRRVQLTPEHASEFYAEHFGKLFFPSLVAYMSSGTIIALALAREKAITYWRELIGPTNTLKARATHPDSLRAIFGTDDQRNALHGSDSTASAEREIRFFFPESVMEPIPVGQTAQDYLSQAVNPTLLKGLTELCKQKPACPIIWLADWLVENNPNKPAVKNTSPIVAEPEM